MPNLSLKRVPKQLHQRLKERAKRNHRSLNSEILICLQDAVMPKRIEANEALERIRALRDSRRRPPLTDEDIQRFKNEGRP